MTHRPPAAVLWDMDGTLVDTEPLWIAAEERLVYEHGGEWTHEDSLALVGSDLLQAADYIRRRGNLPMTAMEIRDHLISEVLRGVKDGIVWRPGARELLAALAAQGIPSALVTMSYRVLAEAVVSELPDGTFTAIVTGDEVELGKPHPEPYLTAARLLGADPTECVVIEDSPPGVASGLAAGARVVGVPNAVPIEPAPGLVLIESLAGVMPAELVPVPA